MQNYRRLLGAIYLNAFISYFCRNSFESSTSSMKLKRRGRGREGREGGRERGREGGREGGEGGRRGG